MPGIWAYPLYCTFKTEKIKILAVEKWRSPLEREPFLIAVFAETHANELGTINRFFRIAHQY